MVCEKRAAMNPTKMSGISGSSIVCGPLGYVSFENMGVRSSALGIRTRIASVEIRMTLHGYPRSLDHFNTPIENAISHAIKMAFNRAIDTVLAEIRNGSYMPRRRLNDVTSHEYG